MDAAAIAERFGLGRARVLDGPVARGKQGAVWRLESSEGRWAVKVPFAPVDEQDVRASTAFQEAAHAAGVPTPRVRRAVDGRIFASVGASQVRVHEWVDLMPPDPLLDPGLVGETVAQLHAVRTPEHGAELDSWHSQAVGARRWDELVEQLREARAPFAGRLADLRDELVALESWLEPPELVQTCHRDLWADNLLPTAGGAVCVVDWEDSGPADPSHELACVLFEFGRTDPGRSRALVEAYRAAGGPARVCRRGHFSMLIAQLGHITATAASDWLSPSARSPQRADAEAWIAEVFDEPHTRAVLDALLAGVRGS